jgi:hypothetical protein
MSKTIVYSKLPNGLKLRFFREVDGTEPSASGPRPIKVQQEIIGKYIYLSPTTVAYATLPVHPLVFGYSKNLVDTELWNEWTKVNWDSDLLTNKTVFSAGTEEDGDSRCKQQANEPVKSGMEPLDPNNSPRLGLSSLKVTTADEQKMRR